jgi:hypothetical protein
MPSGKARRNSVSREQVGVPEEILYDRMKTVWLDMDCEGLS